MSEPAIRTERLSKRYAIGKSKTRYKTLRDSIVGLWHSRGRPSQATSREHIWALKDISFEIKAGAAVGVIGRNGAGKTTLLKVLSRITEPTEGQAKISGRVGSLLEVGTGFHEELTGRENIYLNGAILGMRKREMNQKFDEIVAFAEIEKFIDTPVKYYSSGMYVRLAFAVAAHLEPDILLVDEVLAIGDAQFQTKCLGLIDHIAKRGRTVLFVSHNLTQVRRLCSLGICLEQGGLKKYGPVSEVIADYQSSLALPETRQDLESLIQEKKLAGFISWKVAGAPSDSPNVVRSEAPVAFEVVFSLEQAISSAYYEFVIRKPSGQNVAGWGISGLCLKPGVYKLTHTLSSLPLRPGNYYLYLTCWDGATKIDVSYLLPELVVATPEYSILTEEWAGIVNLPCKIEISSL